MEITNEFSQTKRNDHYLNNIMWFIKISTGQLYKMRNEGICFDILSKEAYDICKDKNVSFLENIKDNFRKTKWEFSPITSEYHFKVELIYTILENIQEELNIFLIK